MPKTAQPWSLSSLREKLMKIGAKVVSHRRCVTVRMAEVAVSRQMFADILSLNCSAPGADRAGVSGVSVKGGRAVPRSRQCGAVDLPDNQRTSIAVTCAGRDFVVAQAVQKHDVGLEAAAIRRNVGLNVCHRKGCLMAIDSGEPASKGGGGINQPIGAMFAQAAAGAEGLSKSVLGTLALFLLLVYFIGSFTLLLQN
jgi:hypothetical protein